MNRLIMSLLACAALVPLSAAQAQDGYPTRPVQFVVNAAPGGFVDPVARIVAAEMAPILGQQIVVENVGGAGGSIGAGQAARAEPDGYTLLLTHVGMATFKPLYPQLPYTPVEDFDSVGIITEIPLTIVGRSDLEPDTIEELLALLREDGEAFTFGTAGSGSISELCGTLLSEALGTEFTVIAYPGTGPAMVDLLGGQIDFMCTADTFSQIESGDLKGYAVTTRERLDFFPDLPTLAESGVEDFEITAWHALWAPVGTPLEIRERLAEVLREALASPTMAERFRALGTEPAPQELASPEALDELFAIEVERWERLLADAR